ncbi:hypothetical protein HMN09_00226600 [Mycena chlorophos]|uniref:Uncharacterized protein n=1 Tax=Mycena chlorophos TaxID=658473 RepID=A0A8H6TJK8_MYCCL|nr:hypothetical protein HMN09_00226600 [Mycena chlorophos]
MPFEHPPPKVSSEIIAAFPKPHVLLVTFNRPKSLNAFTPQMLEDMRQLLNWFEDEPEMWVAVFTGSGRAFCAGADLKAWDKAEQTGKRQHWDDILREPHGFGSVSRRTSKKPYIAAVNGSSYGGGTEFVMNCDLVVASKDANFVLPEVKRGVVAVQGAHLTYAFLHSSSNTAPIQNRRPPGGSLGPPLTRKTNRMADCKFLTKLASEMLLLGDPIKAEDARNRFGFVNLVVPTAEVLPTALALADKIIANSPDSVQSTKTGLIISQNEPTELAVAIHSRSVEHQNQMLGENIKEGLRAFNERRAPVWKNAGTRAKL